MKRKLIKYLLPLSLLFACLGFAACNSPEQLSTPANLRIENGMLLWDEVEYADGYSIYIDGIEYQTTECYYDISGLNEAGIHTLEVVAYHNNGVCSLYADLSYTGKYAVPTQELGYKLSGSKENPYYIVNRFAVNENGWCVIPATYQGIRVAQFTTDLTSERILSQIKGIYLPNSIIETRLQGGAFKRFPNLESIVLGEGHEKFISEKNCLINKETNTLTVGCINSEIPDYVTKIGEKAFYGRNIKTFTAPDQIEDFGIGTFLDCTVLQKAVLPKRLTLPSLALNSMFWGCTSLAEVNIPEGVVSLTRTFRGCTSLTKVNVPEGVTKLIETFMNCTSLKEVILPESMQEMSSTFWGCASLESCIIPSGTISDLRAQFFGCTSLKSIAIGDGIKTWSHGSNLAGDVFGTFQNCISLTDVRLPFTLPTIGSYAFVNCESLKSLMIPKSVTAIRRYAFLDCPLEEIFYGGTETEWNENIKIDESGNETFLSAIRYYYSEIPPEEDGNYWHFVDGVPTVWANDI